MEKHIYLNESDNLSREIVKVAISLPDNNIGNKAKTELINSAMQASSFYKVACFEKDKKESIDNLNNVLEKSGISKFWLEFLRDEGIVQAKNIAYLIQRLADLMNNTIHAREEEQNKLSSKTTYAGEWFLDD